MENLDWAVKSFVYLMIASGTVALAAFAVLAIRRTGYFELLLLFWLGMT